ncbi:hypothetical protein CLCR_10712 [Cladophialophora carrionii]|uniref:Uncharacterized protein n=1 Tax=Cladophialophora carrionii TaxID=86049 RepID=A0A1C1CVJ8_9EURO|nr:hypothetical protein CLCR_10712 [Cladophialophora carrionii]
MKTFTLTLTSTSYLCLAIAATARLAQAQAQSYCDASVGYVLPDSTSDSGTDDTSGYTPDSGDCDAECQLYYSQQQTLYSDYFNDAVTAGGNSFLSAAGGKRKRDHLQHHTRRASNRAAAAAGLSPRQSGGGDGSDGGDLYLTCTAAETCFVYENIPLCIDMATGDFTDPTGGSGNVLTGTYNAAVDTGSSGTTGSDGGDDDDDTDTDSDSDSGSDSTDITSSSSSSSASPNGASSSSSTCAGGITLGAVVFAAVFALLAN